MPDTFHNGSTLASVDGREGRACVRYVAVSGQAAFGLETLKADMAVRCLDRPLSKISIYEPPFRTVPRSGHSWPEAAHIEARPSPALQIDPVVFADLWLTDVPLIAGRRTDYEIEARALRFQVNTEKQLQFHFGYVHDLETHRSLGAKNAATEPCHEAVPFEAR